MDQPPAMGIRRAVPTDLDALTDLHLACFGPADHIPVMLGRGFVRATYRWQLSHAATYVLVAEAEGRLAGLVSVSDRPYTRPMFLACLPQLALSLLRRPALLFRRRLWQRLLRRPANQGFDDCGVAQLAAIAVAEAFRGSGVFAALAQAAARLSRERGSRAIRAAVYKSNTASRRAFGKAGWAEVPLLETPETVTYLVDLNAARSENGRLHDLP